MINREVTYERNLTGSYLKVPQAFDGAFDEKMMLRKQLKSLLPVEQCYFNGQGQYWYNITGLQSLDTYCHIKEPEYPFVEKLILCICDEIDLLERNLISPDSLQFDPEYIFLSQGTEGFSFMIYPGTKAEGITELQKLMDYLITKISHSDPETVKKTYELYELIRREGSSVDTIREAVMRQREERILAENPPVVSQSIPIRGVRVSNTQAGPGMVEKKKSETGRPLKRNGETGQTLWDKMKILLFGERPAKKAERKNAEKSAKKNTEKNAEKSTRQNTEKSTRQNASLSKSLFQEQQRDRRRKESKNQSKNRWELRSSEDLPGEEEMEAEPTALDYEEEYKTVCIRLGEAAPEGILLYEGKEDFENIVMEEGEYRVGKDKSADIQIRRDTISHIHACLSRIGRDYYIEDLNSTNGTFLNDEMLPYKERRALRANDKIRFADVNYRFV